VKSPDRRRLERSAAQTRIDSRATPTPRRGAQGPLAIWIINLAVLAGLGVVLEVGARILFPRPTAALFIDPSVFVRGRPFVEPHPDRGFALKPGFSSNEIRINAAGLRGPEPESPSLPSDVILAVGESSTFGWRVANDQTYPVFLQRELDAMALVRPVHVLNAGVPSYTSSQIEAYLRELIPRYRPALVVASCLWNDALFACLPNWMPENLLQRAPSPLRRFLLSHSGVYRAIAIRSKPVEAGRIRNDRALQHYRAKLLEMTKQCSQHDIKLVLLAPSVDPAHIPSSGMKIGRSTVSKADFLGLLDDFIAELHAVGTAAGVPVIDHQLAHRDPAHSNYFIDPVHLTGPGNAILARGLANRILADGLLAGASRRIASSGPQP
jgi:lysophospholipase L1-like esterase